MQFNIHRFNLEQPESWLIILIFAGFWVYSYYSLFVLLVHTYRQNQSTLPQFEGESYGSPNPLGQEHNVTSTVPQGYNINGFDQ